MSVDLWSLDSLPIPEQRSPAQLLKEQCELFNLRLNTGGLYAEVVSLKAREENRLLFALEIVAPSLGDYRLRVVRCSFLVTSTYPVRVTSDFAPPNPDGRSFQEVGSEEELVNSLRAIFTDVQLRASLSALIANSRI